MGCSDDISVNVNSCPIRAYINYEVSHPLICDNCKISDTTNTQYYKMVPFYNKDFLNLYTVDSWLVSELNNDRNPFYTHCDTLELYMNCIKVDTLYAETCLD